MIPCAYRQQLLLLLITASLACCTPEPLSPTWECGSSFTVSDHPKAAAYQAILNKYISQGLPAISVSITDSLGEWTGAAGKADIAQNIAMEACHGGKIASITKMFIAVLTLQLVEEGKLNLEDPLTKWLPQKVTDKLPNAHLITLAYLLSHQSGLQDYAEDQRFYLEVINDPYKNWTPDELLAYVYNEAALFRPGSRAAYSNINTVLASMMIESATGKSHGYLMDEKILTPLGMNHTFYQGYEPLPKNKIAQGYFDLFEDNTLVNVSDYNFGYGNGAGGLVSNVYDMQTFLQALFVGRTLLNQASLERMRQWYPDWVNDRQLGLGLMKEYFAFGPDVYGYGHGGGDLGYTADLYWFPQKQVSMVTIVNYGIGRGGSLSEVYFDFRRELAEKVLQ